MLPPFKLKEMFLCNFCESICKGPCIDDLNRLRKGTIDEKNKDLIGNRKQRIKCLGRWCDKPCNLQEINAIPSTDVLVNTTLFLGKTVNKLIEENNAIKRQNQD